VSRCPFARMAAGAPVTFEIYGSAARFVAAVEPTGADAFCSLWPRLLDHGDRPFCAAAAGAIGRALLPLATTTWRHCTDFSEASCSITSFQRAPRFDRARHAPHRWPASDPVSRAWRLPRVIVHPVGHTLLPPLSTTTSRAQRAAVSWLVDAASIVLPIRRRRPGLRSVQPSQPPNRLTRVY
jgi:hypothetical protein